jgi:hypothetical protein
VPWGWNPPINQREIPNKVIATVGPTPMRFNLSGMLIDQSPFVLRLHSNGRLPKPSRRFERLGCSVWSSNNYDDELGMENRLVKKVQQSLGGKLSCSFRQASGDRRNVVNICVKS